MPNISNFTPADAQLHALDVLIVAGYLATLVMIGIVHARRQRTLSEFFLASQDIRWLVLGISLVAALNSGLDYLMQPSAMITYGATILFANLTWVLLVPYVFCVPLPLYRRLGAVSAYEYLEHRFDGRTRTLAAGIFVLWRMGWLATAMYVPALAIHTASGGKIPISPCVVVIGAVVTTYTMLGGIRAVIWNDVLQCGIMFLGLVITVAVVVANTDGGATAILREIYEVGNPVEQMPQAGSPSSPLAYFFIPMTAGGMFVAVLVARLTTYTCDQVMIQRFQTSFSARDAKQGFLLNAASDVIWMVSLCFVGLALYAYFKAQFGGMPAWTAEHPDRVFPFFIAQAFPVGLTGLVIAAILAASISSIDSAMNSLTTVLTVDFLQRLPRERDRASLDPAEQRRQVLASRFVTVAVGILGILAATQVNRLGSLLEISNKLINSFTGPLLGIYLLGMFTRRATPRGVIFGGTLGALTTACFAFQGELFSAIGPLLGRDGQIGAAVSFLWPSSIGLVVTLAAGYLSSLLTPAENTSGAAWMWRAVVQSPRE